MERNPNKSPLAGLAGLLAMASLGANEQAERRSSGGRPNLTPELIARMPPELRALLGIKSETEQAVDAVNAEVVKFGGNIDAAVKHSIQASRAAGKLVGVIALMNKAGKLKIAEYERDCDLNNDTMAPEFRDLIGGLTATYSTAQETAETLDTPSTPEQKREQFEFVARVLWANTVKIIRGMAKVARDNGEKFAPALMKVPADSEIWGLLDDAIADEG